MRREEKAWRWSLPGVASCVGSLSAMVEYFWSSKNDFPPNPFLLLVSISVPLPLLHRRPKTESSAPTKIVGY